MLSFFNEELFVLAFYNCTKNIYFWRAFFKIHPSSIDFFFFVGPGRRIEDLGKIGFPELIIVTQERNWGGALRARPPPPALVRTVDMFLIDAQHILHLDNMAMYYLILPITNIPAPPSENYPVAPL